MNSTYPCLKVCDLETTIFWYADFLGFQCTYKSPLNNPDYALIENNGQKIYLIKSERREAYASNIIIIESSDIKAEYQALEKAGVIVIRPIGNGLFSDNEFVIKDYEDNKIIYTQKPKVL